MRVGRRPCRSRGQGQGHCDHRDGARKGPARPCLRRRHPTGGPTDRIPSTRRSGQTMFVQVIKGRTSDAEGLQRQADRWVAEVRPGRGRLSRWHLRHRGRRHVHRPRPVRGRVGSDGELATARAAGLVGDDCDVHRRRAHGPPSSTSPATSQPPSSPTCSASPRPPPSTGFEPQAATGPRTPPNSSNTVIANPDQ